VLAIAKTWSGRKGVIPVTSVLPCIHHLEKNLRKWYKTAVDFSL
jgi:hypothetical protein